MQQQLLILLILLSVCGCSTKESRTPWYMDTPVLNRLYTVAVADASIAEQEEICRTLPAITLPGDNGEMEWSDDEGKQLILVASMMTAVDASRWHSDRSFDLSAEQGETAMPWVTLPHDLRRHIAAFHCADSLELRMRMLQLLGLPPDCAYNYIVFFYADREGLFRPTPDREIDDCEASLNFPPDTPSEYRTWFEENSQFSYKSPTPYPWTRLGYTYDWSADNKSHIGAGEFVVNTGSRVRVKAKLSAWEWYQQIINQRVTGQ